MRCTEMIPLTRPDPSHRLGRVLVVYPDGETPTKLCGRKAIIGATKCWQHAGGLKIAEARADTRREAIPYLGDLVEELFDPDQHPMDGLLEACAVSGAMMRAFNVMVMDLELGGSEVGGSMYGPSHTGDAAPHILLTLLKYWVELHSRNCKLALDAGVDERLVRNAEATSNVLFTAFERALAAVRLTDDQRQQLAQQLGREVRTLVRGIPATAEVSDA